MAPITALSSSNHHRSAQPSKYRASTIQRLIIALVSVLILSLWIVTVNVHKQNPHNHTYKIKAPKLIYRDPQTKQRLFRERADSSTNSNIPPPPNNSAAVNNHRAKATVAYAVSLTSCGQSSTASHGSGGHSSDPNLHEGAAVLAHSVHLSSVRNPSSSSRYDYKLIVFVHTDARQCADVFSDLGYEVLVRPTPFNVTDIKGEFLREHIVKSGCCGEKEYLKLYAYTLLEYPIVVHLDLDSLVLRPLDDLFDAMLLSSPPTTDNKHGKDNDAGSRIPVMFDEPLPVDHPIDAFFTRDYNMVNPGHKHVGVQGGFLVLRPSIKAFNEYVDVVLEGNFKQGNGWGGKGYGGYFGAQQIQGICSYYYDHLHPGTAVELNRCYYNAMTDAPRQNDGRCRDGRETCQDCRDVDVVDIKSAHFTLCKKPWHCPEFFGMETKARNICERLHAEWFRVREDLERKLAGTAEYVNPDAKHRPVIFRGYCKSGGGRGYIPLSQ